MHHLLSCKKNSHVFRDCGDILGLTCSDAAMFFYARGQQSQRPPLTEIMNLKKYIFKIMEPPLLRSII